MSSKFTAIGIVASTMLVFPMASTIAETKITPDEAVLKVNVAGRQRMLTQRIAKSACLMSGQINFENNVLQMEKGLEEFERAHLALINGSPELGMQPEGVDRVTDALAEVKGDWSRYKPYVVEASASGSLSTDELRNVISSSNVVLGTMNDTVGLIAKVYADEIPSVTTAMTITVDIAGRQRMLSQKMVKEMCAATLTGDVSFLETFGETYEIFDLSLQALRNGMPEVGVLPPTNPDVAAKLEEVAELWAPLKPIAAAVAEGELPTAEMLEEFANATEPVLTTMNEAVGLYRPVAE